MAICYGRRLFFKKGDEMNQKNEEKEVIIEGMDAFREFIKENPGVLITLEIENSPKAEKEAYGGRG